MLTTLAEYLGEIKKLAKRDESILTLCEFLSEYCRETTWPAKGSARGLSLFIEDRSTTDIVFHTESDGAIVLSGNSLTRFEAAGRNKNDETGVAIFALDIERGTPFTLVLELMRGTLFQLLFL